MTSYDNLSAKGRVTVTSPQPPKVQSNLRHSYECHGRGWGQGRGRVPTLDPGVHRRRRRDPVTMQATPSSWESHESLIATARSTGGAQAGVPELVPGRPADTEAVIVEVAMGCLDWTCPVNGGAVGLKVVQQINRNVT